jgi:deoxyadenosine/deoxycytidine kinase
MVKIISIEGNIGSGKSTLIKKLNEDLSFKNVLFLPEPVDVWNEIKDTNGVTILEKYYINKSRYSFSFQMMAYITRLSQIKKIIQENTNPDLVLITERCLYTDRYVFAKMLYDSHFIEEIEYCIYLRWFDEFKEFTELYSIIYINTTPSVCLERVKERNRQGEQSISLEYLSECHKYHEDWIDNTLTTTFSLDGNGVINFENIKNFIKRISQTEN